MQAGITGDDIRHLETMMSEPPKVPPLTPDGKPSAPRRDTDESDRSTIGEVQDPALPGDADPDRGYANTDEAVPDGDGLVRPGEDQPRPLI